MARRSKAACTGFKCAGCGLLEAIDPYGVGHCDDGAVRGIVATGRDLGAAIDLNARREAPLRNIVITVGCWFGGR